MQGFREVDRYMNIAFQFDIFLSVGKSVLHTLTMSVMCSSSSSPPLFDIVANSGFFHHHHHHHPVNVFMREKKERKNIKRMYGVYTLMSISSLQTILSSILILNAGGEKKKVKTKIPKHILFSNSNIPSRKYFISIDNEH
jgi:hypothetical protein